MNATDSAILEAVRETLAQVAGVRTARLVRPNETVEIPLGRLPATVLEPTDAETLAWPDVPAGKYHLAHWRVAVLDRAMPGTRAFEALVSLAEACRAAVAADLSLGGRAEDGPPSARDPALAPAVGATRIGPIHLADASPGRPTALEFGGASGYWAETMSGAAAFDDESLFASGPHVILPGSPVHRVKDQAFNGLSGGLSLDLGEGPREIRQTGVLTTATAQGLALLVAAVEAFVDGRAYLLTAPDGTDYPNCRMERFERLSPPQVGAKWHQAHRITYRQLAP